MNYHIFIGFGLLVLPALYKYLFVTDASDQLFEEEDASGSSYGAPEISGRHHLRHWPQQRISQQFRFDIEESLWAGERGSTMTGELIFEIVNQEKVYTGRINFYKTAVNNEKKLIAVHSVNFMRKRKRLEGFSVPMKEYESLEGACIGKLYYELEISNKNYLEGVCVNRNGTTLAIRAVAKR